MAFVRAQELVAIASARAAPNFGSVQRHYVAVLEGGGSVISEFYRPLCVSAFRQRAGHLEYRRDPVSRRGWWLTFGPGGSHLGAYSTKERERYALEQNTLRLCYRASQFDPPEWPAYDAWDGLLEIWGCR